MKIVIIGGVAGGATAAARLRRLNESAEIIIMERSGYISYANCGLPYYIGGIIEKKQALTLQTPQSFFARFRIDVRIHNEVTSIDKSAKTVTVNRLDDNNNIISEYSETYDKLILSPGAKAAALNFSGVDDERVFTLRTVEDTYRIHDFIKAQKPKTASVVGGGFIGLEMAENLIHAGINTTVFQYDNQVMPPVDYDMACQIHSYLRSQKVNLRLNETVVGFSKTLGETAGAIYTEIKGKEAVPSDFVILAVGVVPETSLAKDAEIKLSQKGAIVVDEHMQTSCKDIYAVGDAVEINNFVTGSKALIPLAGPANKQARIAADNICGINSIYKGTQGSSVIKLFDMTVASTGINEKTAKAAGICYDKVFTFSASHASYYPNANNMTIKTIFDPNNGKILGAQITGFDGVDKRIDVMATAIRAGMTAADLEELELAYAPPFSSAKDPVNMAGFVIENIRNGLVKQHHWHDIDHLVSLAAKGEITLLDTMTVGEFENGQIENSINIPLDNLRDRLSEIPKDKPVYVNCFSGLRSYIACRILSQNGFDCSNLAGGYRFYSYIIKDKSYDAVPSHSCGLPIA